MVVCRGPGPKILLIWGGSRVRSSSLTRRFVVVTAITAVLTSAFAGNALAAEQRATAAVAAAPAGTLTTITPGLKGFDSLNIEKPSQIACLSAAGYGYDMVNTNDTTKAEYANAAAAGLKVVLFQGYYSALWTSETGGGRAGKATAAAAGLQYPQGAMIFLDLESANTDHARMLLGV
jgi:hypothetical protein